jgi:flagellar basal body-associated protein FliL
MEEASQNGKESLHSAHANGMNIVIVVVIIVVFCVIVIGVFYLFNRHIRITMCQAVTPSVTWH